MTGGDTAFCTQCGRRLGERARFCPACGAAVSASPAPPPVPPVPPVPPSAPPSPPAGPFPAPAGPPAGPASAQSVAPRRGRAAIIAAVALGVVVAVVLAVVVLGDGDDEPTTRGTGSPATAAPRVTTLPTTTLPPSATAPPARRYVGLERDQGALPVGVTEVGGTFLIPDYGVAWVQGPEGTMFWLERVVATGPDGSVSRWRVVDVVTPPPLQPNASDVIVVLGGTRCEVNGSPSSDVVGVFANTGQEWMDVPRVVWQVDRAAGRLVPLTASVRCINEGYGV